MKDRNAVPCPVKEVSMDRRLMLKESLRTMGRSLPGILDVLAGGGLLLFSQGRRQDKELRVDIGGSPAPPPSAPCNQKVKRRIAE